MVDNGAEAMNLGNDTPAKQAAAPPLAPDNRAFGPAAELAQS